MSKLALSILIPVPKRKQRRTANLFGVHWPLQNFHIIVALVAILFCINGILQISSAAAIVTPEPANHYPVSTTPGTTVQHKNMETEKTYWVTAASGTTDHPKNMEPTTETEPMVSNSEPCPKTTKKWDSGKNDVHSTTPQNKDPGTTTRPKNMDDGKNDVHSTTPQNKEDQKDAGQLFTELDQWVQAQKHKAEIAEKRIQNTADEITKSCAANGSECLQQTQASISLRAAIIAMQITAWLKVTNLSRAEIARQIERNCQLTQQLKELIYTISRLNGVLVPQDDCLFEEDCLLTGDQSISMIQSINQSDTLNSPISGWIADPPPFAGGDGFGGLFGGSRTGSGATILSQVSGATGALLKRRRKRTDGRREKRGGNSMFLEQFTAQRWDPQNPISFYIDPALDQSVRPEIRGALAQISSSSCLTFTELGSKPANNQPPKGQTSWLFYTLTSDVTICGLSAIGKNQTVNIVYLNPSCQNRQGVCIHETLHALGCGHEHTRPDRDDSVTIVWSNIPPGNKNFFDQDSKTMFTSYGEPYDYRSIMHYASNVGSRGGSTSINAKKNPQTNNALMGQRTRLSSEDIALLNKMYCKNSSCVDKLVDCGHWAVSNYCSKSAYTKSNCPKSCNQCT